MRNPTFNRVHTYTKTDSFSTFSARVESFSFAYPPQELF